MIRIIINKDCNLINVIADLEINKFINYYLFIKKTSSSALSAFCLDV